MNKNIIRILMGIYLVTVAGYSFADAPVQNNPDGSQTLLGHVPKVLASAKLHHHAASNEQLSLRLILPVANQSELDTLLKGLYDPTNHQMYHQFLTSDQFNKQYKASDADLSKLKQYLSSKGFVITNQSANGTLLDFVGSVGSVEHTFGLHINHYVKDDGTMFFAPDANPTLSAEIAGKVSAISGLNNVTKLRPHFNQVTPNQLPQQLSTNQVVASPHVFTGPLNGVSPNDVKKAYNLNAIPTINDPSSLQNVALFELDGYLPSDIVQYEVKFGLPTSNNSLMLQNVYVDGYAGAAGSGSGEVTLDIEELLGIAYGSINKLYVYEAPNTWQGWQMEWNKIAADNTSKIISCSWGLGENESDSPSEDFVAFDNGVFQQMAAQGQEVFVASGDCGVYGDGSPETGVPQNCKSSGGGNIVAGEPATQPYATGVGISVLSINSDGSYKSETASLYGGGGISLYNKIPAYQQTMANQATSASGVSKTWRNVPDVSLTSDPSTYYSFYIGGSWGGWWGSSIAAPTWAAFLAIVNQGLTHAGHAPIGFLNPTLYTLAANSGKYANDFHDITTGNNGAGTASVYLAQTGFDDATGLGSFNGANMYTDLLNTALGTVAPPSGLLATAGNNKVTLTWNASTGATSYQVFKSTVSNVFAASLTTVSTPTYVDNSVSNGTTYYYEVNAVNSSNVQSTNSSQVSVTPFGPPSAPTTVTAVAGYGQATVTFSGASANGGTITNYTVTSSPGNISNSGSVSPITVSGLTNGTPYTFTVKATNAAGTSSASIASNSVTPSLAAGTPLPPTSVSAVAGNAQATVTFSGASGNGGSIKSYTVTSSPGNISASGAISPITISGLINGTTYTFTVKVTNSLNLVSSSSVPSNSVIPLPPPPPAPTGLQGAGGNNQVALTWSATAGATSYHVKKSLTNGNYQTIATVTTPAFTDKTVTNWITYFYVVSAVNSSGVESVTNSNMVEVVPYPPLPAPTGFSATATSTSVTLKWTAIASTEFYYIYRLNPSTGAYNYIGDSTSTSYTDTNVVSGSTYYYEIAAYEMINGTGFFSLTSSPLKVIVLAQVPTNLLSFSGSNIAAVTWSGSLGATSYNIKRSIGNANSFSLLASGLTISSYTDSTVKNGTVYYYEVSAVNAGGESANSTAVSAAPALPTTPSAVTGLSATETTFAGKPAIALQWKQSTSSNLYYNSIYYSISNGGYGKLANINLAASATITGASKGVTYNFYVTAVNTSGMESAPSNKVTIVLK